MTKPKGQIKLKAQLSNKIQMTKTTASPSPVLTLALSSKWRGEAVEGEENKRAGQETRDCFVAGFCDDAALKLKRTLNGKSSVKVTRGCGSGIIPLKSVLGGAYV